MKTLDLDTLRRRGLNPATPYLARVLSGLERCQPDDAVVIHAGGRWWTFLPRFEEHSTLLTVRRAVLEFLAGPDGGTGVAVFGADNGERETVLDWTDSLKEISDVLTDAALAPGPLEAVVPAYEAERAAKRSSSVMTVVRTGAGYVDCVLGADVDNVKVDCFLEKFPELVVVEPLDLVAIAGGVQAPLFARLLAVTGHFRERTLVALVEDSGGRSFLYASESCGEWRSHTGDGYDYGVAADFVEQRTADGGKVLVLDARGAVPAVLGQARDAGEFLRLAGSLMAKRPDGRPGLTDAEWTARRIQHVAQADAAVAVVHLGGGKFVAGMPYDYPELDWRDGGYGYWGDDRLAHVVHDAASGRYLLQCWEPDGTPVPRSEEFATNEAAVQHAEEWLLKINVQPTPVGWTRPGDPVSADEVLVLATSFILAGTHVHLFDAPSRRPVGRASSMLQLLRAFAKVQGLFTPSTT